ncbi:hypothetical protein OE88DRAFT_428078 [Heliocybe sulcata]|uniref:Uncharacterized protein n=1 Tax=Heliocybe sulcata TaxID=5364 RepID=A0A5C3MX70_9AGAM|nr:hypothetical protein OE88DRAFT_428078 [Heliocybe sulcata]
MIQLYYCHAILLFVAGSVQGYGLEISLRVSSDNSVALTLELVVNHVVSQQGYWMEPGVLDDYGALYSKVLIFLR